MRCVIHKVFLAAVYKFLHLLTFWFWWIWWWLPFSFEFILYRRNKYTQHLPAVDWHFRNVPTIHLGIMDCTTQQCSLVHQFFWNASNVHTCPTKTPFRSWAKKTFSTVTVQETDIHIQMYSYDPSWLGSLWTAATWCCSAFVWWTRTLTITAMKKAP